MRLKTLFIWIGSTLLLSAVASLILTFLLQPWMGSPKWLHHLLTGLTLGAVAELGLFSYQIFSWLCRGLIRSQSVYQGLLAVILLIVGANLLYLFDQKYSAIYLTVPAAMLLVSLVVATWKSKLTSWHAWIPTLFFMFVVTTLEAIPSIDARGVQVPLAVIFFTVTILLLCNAWQILRLHHWLSAPKTKKARASASSQ